jgi:hypothetical protein
LYDILGVISRKVCYRCYMPKAKTEAKPALNIRDVPPDLMARLKRDAATAHVTLREWCLTLLGLPVMVGTLNEPTATKPAVEALTASLPVTTASQLPPKEGHPPGSTTDRCPRCTASLIPWGPGQKRCRTCAVNFPAG